MKPLSLAEEFPQADEAAWMELVTKALRGAKYESLVSETSDGLQVKPLYTRADGTEQPLPPIGSHPVDETLDQPGWDIRQLYANADPGSANKDILDDLEGGVTSIALQFAAPGQSGLNIDGATDLERVLDGVHPEYAPISLHAGVNTGSAAAALQDVWERRGISSDKASGAFNADPLGTLAQTGGLPTALDQAMDEMCDLARTSQDRFPNVTSVLVNSAIYHNGGASEAEELACLCSTLVAYLRALEGKGVELARAFSQISFLLASDTDQFLSMAKLRAARLLIARIEEVSGAAAEAGDVRITAITSERMLAATDPWVNILRTSMACAASAMGGANAITVLPFTWAIGQPDRFAQRLARNVQIVLQEESSLGVVSDPAAGSWYVDSLTNELAGKAWELFQELEQRGGMAKALSQGTVQSMIAATAEARAGATATGAKKLTGVSAYPEISETEIDVIPVAPVPEMDNPAITVEPVPLRKPAEPFDRLRAAARAHAKGKDSSPSVFLVNLGKPSDFAVRSTYARNFFAAAGIDAIESSGFENGSDAAKALADSKATLACICSNNETYADMAAATAKAISGADIEHLYLAGRPGDLRKELRSAGVGTFIHEGCDMVEILDAAHSYLGIKPAWPRAYG